MKLKEEFNKIVELDYGYRKPPDRKNHKINLSTVGELKNELTKNKVWVDYDNAVFVQSDKKEYILYMEILNKSNDKATKVKVILPAGKDKALPFEIFKS